MPPVKITRTQANNGAPTSEVTPQEADAIRSSVGGKDQAPSMQQLAGYVNWRQVADSLGDPFNNEHIPISKLRLMRRDPIIGFGLSFIKTPHVRARWYIDAKDTNGPNAQVAAHLDYDLRRIIASLIMQWANSLDFGFQSVAKRFEFGIPAGTYVTQNPDGSMAEEPIWSQGNVQPIRWKPFVALPPETVEPNWAPDGSFNGTNWDGTLSKGALPGGTGATPSGEENKFDIDLYHCSPPDEPVLTVNRGYVPIGELDERDDLLVVWDKKQKRICRQNGYSFEKSYRQYSGDLLTVSTSDSSIRITPNHKFTVRWTPEVRDKQAVYLMRKGDWWRIGVTRLIKPGRLASGIGQRVSNEGADAAWVLKLCDSKNEAFYYEKLWSNTYKIPDMIFRYEDEYRSANCLTTDQIESIWSQTDSQTGALRLLDDIGLDSLYPFFEPAGDGKMVARGMRGWTCRAVNLLPGVMEIPEDPGEGFLAHWETITSIDKSYYNGDVVSIDVPPHHHYVSSGIITQNSLWITNERDQNFGSIFGYPRLGYAYSYWWSYWFRWAITDRAFEKKADPTVLIKHPQGEFVDPSTGQTISYADYALNMGYRMRSGGIMTIPSTPYEGANGPTNLPEWDVDFTKDMVNFDPFDKSFDYLDIGKIRALWIPEQSLVEGKGGTSSRNVAAELDSSFTESQAVMSVQIAETINRWIIPQWLAVNYPEFLASNGTAQIVIQGFADEDVTFTQQIIQLIGQQPAGISKFLTLVDLEKILDDAGVPLLDIKSQQIEQARVVAQAQAGMVAQPNPVQPKAGPNGTVGVLPTGSTGAPPNSGGNDPGGTVGDNQPSATGFSMQYVQPREVIYLSSKDVYGDDDNVKIKIKRVPDSDDGIIARFDPDENTVFLAESATHEDSQKYLAAIGQTLVKG